MKLCFRKACYSKVTATFFNESTKQYYCRKCALAINFFAKKPICKEETRAAG